MSFLPDEDQTPKTPIWQRSGLWPGPVAGPWSWEALAAAHERHGELIEALAAARGAEDATAERKAIDDLCEHVKQVLAALRLTLPDAEAAFEAAREEAKAALPIDRDNVVPEAERDRYRQMVRDMRGWLDADVRLLRRVVNMLEPERFWPPGGSATVPSLVAEVEAARQEAARA